MTIFDMKQKPLYIGVVVFVLAGLALWRIADKAEPVVAGPEPAAFSPALKGTSPDGNLQVAGDTLTVTEDLRRLFDYYLSTYGQRDIAQIEAEIGRELDGKLPPAAARQAREVLKRYLDYKRALVELEKDPSIAGNSSASLHARLAAMQKVRARFFNAQESLALFGNEERDAVDVLARQEIRDNASLSPAERQAKLAALDAKLPPEALAARQAPVQHLALADAVAAAREKGATPEQVFHIRELSVGAEAAERLAVLDREEEAWRQRIQQYLADRTGILKDAARNDAQKESAIQQLRDARFNADEQRRLSAYE